MSTGTQLRERSFSWEDPAALAATGAAMSGLELLRAILEGTVAPPPVAAMLDFAIVEVERGRAVFRMQPAEWMYNPLGSVHGGVVATLLDTCMGCAVHTLLAAGVGYTTTDLHVRYVRPLVEDTGPVLAEGTVLHCGKRTAAAAGRLLAEDGDTLFAYATTGAAILR